MRTVFSESVAEFTIRDGLVFIRYPGEAEPFDRCMPIPVFRECLRMAHRALDEHFETQPIPLHRRRG